MRYNQPPSNRVQTDRFGNPYQLITAEQKTDRKTGEVLESIYQGWIELGNSLYKIEISPRNKETRSGKAAMWVKVTKTTKRKQVSSM
jgi:hypothetical protein